MAITNYWFLAGDKVLEIDGSETVDNTSTAARIGTNCFSKILSRWWQGSNVSKTRQNLMLDGTGGCLKCILLSSLVLISHNVSFDVTVRPAADTSLTDN